MRRLFRAATNLVRHKRRSVPKIVASLSLGSIAMDIPRVNSHKFYETYHGHKVEYLAPILQHLRASKPENNVVFFAGDSSLDNKYWITGVSPALNGYETILNPPQMVQDVSYYLNKLCAENNKNYFILNTSVEATTLGERGESWLGTQNAMYPQDDFIRDNIRPNDILIVSVGGNDIALNPTFSTAMNMLSLVYLNDKETIGRDISTTWGGSYFIQMFSTQTQKYIERLTEKTKPKKILVCVIYYPDEKATGSWADGALGILGYNSEPEKLQAAINQIYLQATSQVKIPGSEVIPFPMFKYMDGKDTKDYVQRVEPSSQGGRKLAAAFYEHLE